MRFVDIIGQDMVKEQLRRGVDSGRISHAQLFSGRCGAGILPLAIAYVQYLNCTNRYNGDSCGVCASCQQISNLSHPDLHFVFPVNKQGKKSGEVVLSDDFLPMFRDITLARKGYFSAQDWYDKLNLGKTLKGSISSKESDAIIHKLSYKSFVSEYKSMIIWLPETMNVEAANKILKILEEPWEKTLFILVSERPDKLLSTIISRTQELIIPPISVDILMEQVAKRQNSEPSHIRNLARLSNGDILELEYLLSGDSSQMRQDNFDFFCSLMRFSYNDKHLELMSWAEEIAQLNRDRQRLLLQDFVRLLREAYMYNAGVGELSYLWGAEADFCKKFSLFVDNDNIELFVAEIEQAIIQITQNGNATIVFTHFALQVSKYVKKRS